MVATEKLQEAMKYLAAACDGATTKDQSGFCKTDVSFGHSLAKQPYWTPRQAQAAQKMLIKYRKQLEAAGFGVELFEKNIEPQKPSSRPKIEKTASLVEDRIVIRFPFDQDTLRTVKTIPGRRFQNTPGDKHWEAPLSKDAVDILMEAGFKLDDKLKAFQAEKTVTPVQEMQEIEVPGLKRELYPFQKKGVAFIEQKKGRALIADEMGLGKTIQALAWIQLHPERRPVLIVCPAHLKLNWAREINMTLEETPDVEILSGITPYPIRSKDIVIINYDILKDWVDTLKQVGFKVLIVDEAHYIKNSKAQRTRVLRQISKGIPHVIALTGTPIINRPIEGFNIIQLIDRTLFPNFWYYAQKYCGAKRTPFGWDLNGVSNETELHEKLTKSVMIRRKKADILTDLPDKVYSYIPLELSNQEEYRMAEANFIRFLKQNKGKEAAQKASNAEHLVRTEALKQLAVKGKLPQAIAWIRDFLDQNGQKLVVFAVHKETINQLMKVFKDVAVKVDGSTPAQQRDAAVQAFQNDPTIRLFVGNIQAAGTGLTLTAASAVAFLELPWSPAILQQAEDRCHRIGQKESVNIYYLLADTSIELDIARLLDQKKIITNAIIDGGSVEDINLISELMEVYLQK